MMDKGDYVEKEKELKRERKFLRNVMATIPDFMLILDRELRIKNANRSCYELFQTEPENIVGRKITDMLGDTDGKLSAKLVRLFGTADMLENFELHYHSEKLGDRILNIMARGMIVAEEEEEEEEEEELVVIQDITERKKAEERLRTAEQNFRNSLDDSPVGIRIVTVDGELLYANKAILDIYGYSSIKELETVSTKERYTPESYAEHQERKESRKLGKPVPSSYEISIVRKDGGEIRHLLVHRKEVLWNGKTQFQVLYQNITERKLAEEALNASNRSLALLNSTAIELASIRTKRDLYVYIASKLKTLTGVGSATFGTYDLQKREIHVEHVELDQNPTTDLIQALGVEKLTSASFPISDDARRDLIQNPVGLQRTLSEITFGVVSPTIGKIAQKAQGIDRFVGVAYVVDGELYGTSVLALRTGQPEPSLEMLHSFANMVAVSLKRLQAEVSLRESEEKYSTLIERSNDGIIIIQEGAVTYANQRILEMTGYSLEEALGRPFVDFISSEHRRMAADYYSRRIAGDDVPDKYEFDIITKDGGRINIEISASLFEYGGKGADMVIIRDIRERKKMQEQLMAQDRLASIGQLVSGVAHEINNPLTGVIGFSELLLKRDLPDDVKADLKVVNDEAMRTARIVKNLLTFARKQPEGKEPVDINKQIQRVLDLRDHEQKVNNINVDTHFASNLPQVMGNASQLQQVFFNIVINAEFFMLEAHQKGNLTITTERTGDSVRCSFADDGPGIPEENMRNLFTPFFTTKEVGKGTGLGLSICYGIITEHGGRIYAESKLGKGATFIVELPIKEATTSQEVAE